LRQLNDRFKVRWVIIFVSSVTFFLSILHFAVFSAAAVFSAISLGSGGGQIRIGQ